MFALDGTQVTVAALGAASAIIVAFVGVVGVLLARRMERRMDLVHVDNRSDHLETAAKVDRLLAGHVELASGQQAIAADIRDVKADVRELKATDRRLETRIDEHIAGEQPKEQ